MNAPIKWFVDKLIEARISFSLTAMPDGQWNIGVDLAEDSEQMKLWIQEWKQSEVRN